MYAIVKQGVNVGTIGGIQLKITVVIMLLQNDCRVIIAVMVANAYHKVRLKHGLM